MDSEILQAALVGLEHRRAQIDQKIAQVHELLGEGASGQASPVAPTPQKRKMSAAGRQRIAEGQRKRWAAVKRAKVAEKRLSARKVANRRAKAAVETRAVVRNVIVKAKKVAPKRRATTKPAAKRPAPKKAVVKKVAPQAIATTVPAEAPTA